MFTDLLVGDQLVTEPLDNVNFLLSIAYESSKIRRLALFHQLKYGKT